MLCRNFGEAFHFIVGIALVTAGLGAVTIASHLGLIQWEWFEPGLVWGAWLGSLVLGALVLLFSPMH